MSFARHPETLTTPTTTVPTYHAEHLIPDGCLANIVLGENVYTLRITKAGKLILTK